MKNIKSEYKEKKIIKIFNIKITLQSILSFFLFIFIIFFNNFYETLILNLKIKKYYKKRIHFLLRKKRKYNESNLLTFEDKINWLIIHDTNSLKGKCADKILIHKYSKKILGKDICNKILKIYNKINDIKLNELPNKFVIKTNHGSGYNIIVKDKKIFNLIKAKKKLKYWMNIDYGKIGAEFHYSFIKKKVFIEEYIGSNLKNYKFLCYNGIPKYVYISIKIGGKKYRNFYDMNWNFLNFYCLSKPHPTYIYPKPKLFNKMKIYAQKLSKNFKFVRVDLYEIKCKEIKLGELTFAPMNSFFYCKKKEDEIKLGFNIKIK